MVGVSTVLPRYARNAHVSVWSYDTLADGTACPQGIGKLCEVRSATLARGGAVGGTLDQTPGSGNSPIRRLYLFDDSGRPSQTLTQISEAAPGGTLTNDFRQLAVHDARSRIEFIAYPSGLILQQRHTAWSGQLDRLAEWHSGAPGTPGSTGTVYWQADSRNPDGRIARMQTGPLTTRHTYDLLNRLTHQNGQPICSYGTPFICPSDGLLNRFSCPL